MPSNLPGGVWGLGDLAVFGRFGVKNDPKKKFPNVFGDTLGVWGLSHFWVDLG